MGKDRNSELFNETTDFMKSIGLSKGDEKASKVTKKKNSDRGGKPASKGKPEEKNFKNKKQMQGEKKKSGFAGKEVRKPKVQGKERRDKDANTGVPLYTFTLSENQMWYNLSDAGAYGKCADGSSSSGTTGKDKNNKNIGSFASMGAALERGKALYTRMVMDHSLSSGSDDGEDHKWIRSIIKDGTASDKVAGLTMMVQQSPLTSISSLDSLLALAHKKEQRLALIAMEAIKDLLVHNLLPDRKLVREGTLLATAPTGRPVLLSDRQVMLLHFESELADRVERFVDAIERSMHNNVEYFKKKSIEVAQALLAEKMEQEGRLLTLLVNKVGDPAGGVATCASELVLSLASKHPAMTGVIMHEIRQFLHRSQLKQRALHAGVVCLCRLPLSRSVPAQALEMVETLAGLFEKAVASESGSGHLLAALLSGFNKAFPLIKDPTALTKHVDVLFKIAHDDSLASSTQALLLISQIVLSAPKGSENSESAGDDAQVRIVNRFYRALYTQLLTHQLSARAHNTLFLNLIFRAMKQDTSVRRVVAFVKRLHMRTTQCPPEIATGILLLVSELCQARPELKDVLFVAPNDVSDKDAKDTSAYGQLDDFNLAAREPLFAANDDSVVLWESALLHQHVHPSVRAFQRSLSSAPKHHIAFEGDPTVEFKLSSCINRFAYKNPKKQTGARLGRRGSHSLALQEEPLNRREFRAQDEDRVQPDLAFFHKFFGEQAQLRKEKRRKAASRKSGASNGGSDDDDDDDDEEASKDELAFETNEDEIDAFADKLAQDMLKASAGGAGGGGFGDDDDDDDDFDAAAYDEALGRTGSDDDDNNDDDDDDAGLDLMEGGGTDSDNDGVDDDDGDDDDDDEEEAKALAPKGKKRKKRDGDDIFASADDFTDEMELNVAYAAAHSSTAEKASAQKSGKQEAKAAKTAKKEAIKETIAPALQTDGAKAKAKRKKVSKK